jgi:pimeloyl-ACP methyl ester carboxylesterase
MIPKTQYAWSGDISIAYQVVGDGPLDLVIVAGWVSNIDLFWEEPSFVRFFHGLSEFSRVILFDKRGCGLSDKVLHAPPLEERMDDVLAVMDAVGSEHAALFGYSEGGSMSSLFAATHPERTQALIICGGYARKLYTEDYPWGMSEEEHNALIETYPSKWGGPVGIEKIAHSMTNDPRYRAWWAKFLRSSASITTATLISRANKDVDIRHILPSVQVPTLILHARDDPMVPVENGHYLAKQIPGASLVELDTPDHLPWVGNPEKVLAEIKHFLTGRQTIHDVNSVVVTVLFTDIVDSTRLASDLGNTAWRDLLDAHNDVVRHELAIHRGEEVKSTGDGFHAIFDGPARAIRCGRAIQEAVNRIGVSVRIGMHTGECELRSDQIEGVAVHIAARVSGLAKGGEVLVSQTVKDLVAGAGFEFEDRGVHELKGVPEEWRILAVV